jgi:signal peptidase II
MKRDIKIDKRKLFIILLTAVIVIAADQITKLLANRFLNATYNYGAAFGLFQDSTTMLIWISIIVIGIIIYFYDKIPKKTSVMIYIALILGGTISNLIDRIFHGYVIDFIDLRIWPSFNIADAVITIGVIGLILYLLKRK